MPNDFCDCFSWCRTDIRFKDGKPLPMTRHHPRCVRVDESLMDVWRVQTPGDAGGLIADSEEQAREIAIEDPEAPLEVTPQKMHREIFERLPEFAGF